MTNEDVPSCYRQQNLFVKCPKSVVGTFWVVLQNKDHNIVAYRSKTSCAKATYASSIIMDKRSSSGEKSVESPLEIF